jgi:hypothetical protein
MLLANKIKELPAACSDETVNRNLLHETQHFYRS